MRNITTILIIFSIFTGCRYIKDSSQECIEFADSLTIKIDKHRIKVALIDLKQDAKICPYTLLIYNRLIVLNMTGTFYAFNLDCIHRDYDFEKRINKIKLRDAFVLSDTIYGLDSLGYTFYYNIEKEHWIRKRIPFSNYEPIFENDKYICYSLFHGEFGGYVFFLNKALKRITFTPTSLNTVGIIEKDSGFYIVSKLDFFHKCAAIDYVENPDLLFNMSDSINNKNWSDKSDFFTFKTSSPILKNKTINIFFSNEKLLTSGFKINNENLFLLSSPNKDKRDYNINNLALMKNDSLILVKTLDTIFSQLPATNMEITKKVKNYTIIDFVGNIPKSMKIVGLNENPELVVTYLLGDTSLIRINWTK
jgi:hypothetical protein